MGAYIIFTEPLLVLKYNWISRCPEQADFYTVDAHEKLPQLVHYILSRAIEVGSPMNHLGSRQRRDMDEGPFNPLIQEKALSPFKKYGPTLDLFY